MSEAVEAVETTYGGSTRWLTTCSDRGLIKIDYDQFASTKSMVERSRKHHQQVFVENSSRFLVIERSRNDQWKVFCFRE